jgi:hypothetical protein
MVPGLKPVGVICGQLSDFEKEMRGAGDHQNRVTQQMLGEVIARRGDFIRALRAQPAASYGSAGFTAKLGR